jgi:hypothetical protein
MEQTVERLKSYLRDLNGLPRAHVQMEWNNNVAAARLHFLRILYARIFILRAFLSMTSLDDMTRLRKQWLVLQVAPRALLGVDVFAEFIHRLSIIHEEFFATALSTEMQSINELMGDPLFCANLFSVIDESQNLADMFTTFFRSVKDPTHDRPLLREVVQTAMTRFPRTIISGTGLSMDVFESILNSLVAKSDNEGPKTVFGTGAFDNEDDLKPYLEYYFPPGMLGTHSGRALVSRIGYWLHGRYDITHHLFCFVKEAADEHLDIVLPQPTSRDSLRPTSSHLI